MQGTPVSLSEVDDVEWNDCVFVVQERRKKEREVEEKRLAAERAAEDERRKTAEVSLVVSRAKL